MESGSPGFEPTRGHDPQNSAASRSAASLHKGDAEVQPARGGTGLAMRAKGTALIRQRLNGEQDLDLAAWASSPIAASRPATGQCRLMDPRPPPPPAGLSGGGEEVPWLPPSQPATPRVPRDGAHQTLPCGVPSPLPLLTE